MNEAESEYQQMCAELKHLRKRVEELDGQRNTFRNLAKLTDKKRTALEDGMRELADDWDKRQGWRFGFCANDIRALLDKEPAPSPPPADDGTDAADGVGS